MTTQLLPRDVFAELLELFAGDNLEVRMRWLERFDQAGVDALHNAPVATDLPYEDVPDGPITVALPGDEELVLIDNVNARSTVLAGEAGTVPFALPIVILDLQQGRASIGEPPLLVHRVGIVGPPDILRKVGKLLRDACYGAANAVERAK